MNCRFARSPHRFALVSRRPEPYREGSFTQAIAWWPRHIEPGTVNMDMWSHMDWWPTFAKLAGLEPPPHDWKDNEGNPTVFDGIDLSKSLRHPAWQT